MKVAFDISILGAEERTPENRTGIYKAIEALLKHLLLLKKQGLAEDLELMGFSSDFRQLETSQEVWQNLLNGMVGTEEKYPYLGKLLLSPVQKMALRLSDRKALRKLSKKPYLLESIAMWVFRPFFRQVSRQWSSVIAKHMPHGTIVHIPFTRDVDKFPPTSGLIRVVTCYDLTPILCEARSKLNPKEKAKHEAMLNLMTPDDFVCCISNSAQQDLFAFRPDLKLENLVVTYLGADMERFSPVSDGLTLANVRRNYNIPESAPYLLTVGTLFYPHKNVAFAIRNFLEICDKQSIADDFVLVLCGGKRKFTAEVEALFLKHSAHRHRVIVTGYVADADLSALYSGATGFVLPSLYEGFGLPVLEAMQCGTPVLCSNTASLPEVGGDAALYASPTDGTEFQQQIVTLLNNPELRQQMVKKGFEQAKKFSWEQSAKDTLVVYRKAYESFLAGTPT
ncbi:MAG: glycosyltransferase family 4 protein [Vampirovibrio sp.]|nr:glycosyltransferase family 4 protein [Vampirovibrio sp.]